MREVQHVIFGSGPLGRAVMNELLRHGEQVRVVNRSGHMAEVPDGVEVVAGDAYQAENVRYLTCGARAVYQCAQPPYEKWVELFPALQASILEGLVNSRAKLVIGDNLYMYGEPGGKALTEETPYNAQTRKGRTRARLAEAALAAHRAGKVRVTIGRGSDYFGPWALNSTLGERVFYKALAGKASQFIGRLDLPHTYTYIEDFGRALVLLAEHDEADGQAWHVPNDQPDITQAEMARLIFETVGKPPKFSGMGRMMMAVGGLFIPEARESLEMMYEFEQPFMVDSSKFEAEFGLKATPLPEAMRATTAWYRTHPKH